MESNGENKFHRRSLRLRGYDYSRPGGYYVTICTARKQPFFGKIVQAKVILSHMGNIAMKCWLDIPRHFPSFSLDKFIIMPNHVHGILWINLQHSKTASMKSIECRGVQLNAPTKSDYYSQISPLKNTLGVIIRTYKAAVTTRCDKLSAFGFSWQRYYHDHIIRDKAELFAIRKYIINNPANWNDDEFYRAR